MLTVQLTSNELSDIVNAGRAHGSVRDERSGSLDRVGSVPGRMTRPHHTTDE